MFETLSFGFQVMIFKKLVCEWYHGDGADDDDDEEICFSISY
jgi:hypothetical protein